MRGRWAAACAWMLACGSSSNDAPPAPIADAGVDAPPTADAAPPPKTHVKVTTTRPAGEAVDATWSAYRDDDGWHALKRTALATYELDTTAARVTVAFACEDRSASVVSFHERTTSASLAIVLDDECKPPLPSNAWTIAGTLQNVPTTTSWLDFGYPHESRGSALPLQGTNAEYEEVNVDEGTWDLAFGLRDDATKPLTRVFLKRGYANTSDTTLDLDMATAIVPIPKKLDVTGFVDGETLDIGIVLNGLAVGPQNPTVTALALHDAWDTMPESALVAADRYRLALVTTSSASERTIRGAFHDATDLALVLPPSIAAPTATRAGTKITATLPTYPNASLYEAIARVDLSRDARRVFRVTVEPSFATAPIDVVPDAKTAPGYDTTWNLPSGESISVFARATENPSQGLVRTSATAVVLPP